PVAGFPSTKVTPLALLFLFLTFTDAKEILVGGKTDARKIPSSESNSLNKWAEKARFRIGDSLFSFLVLVFINKTVWKYDGGKDSVLQVTKEAYVSCNTSKPLAEYKDGDTKVEFQRSGPFFFISGAKGHCEQGQKMVVVVLSQKHRSIGISPAPSPAEFEGPAIAPTSGGAGLKAGLLVTLFGAMVLGLF
ncbi:early nodulin-like protein 1, partial [Hibiscus syriacus]|uniref:early nodulin-like protein 1 n=1 Tax=Hibiscus syriacus TaxID=106335 RepID=UPI0019208814